MRRKKADQAGWVRLPLVVTYIAISFSVEAEVLSGRVVHIADGDTITILDNTNTQHKIRLSGIDAPERKQAFGERSRQALADAVAGQKVVIDWSKRDRYERIVGKVLVNGKDANWQQVRNGMAWHYKKYENEQDVKDRSDYAQAEHLAQQDKIGLWSDKEQVAPWTWRKTRR